MILIYHTLSVVRTIVETDDDTRMWVQRLLQPILLPLLIPTTTSIAVTNRRNVLQHGLGSSALILLPLPPASNAYTPDPDPLQEALYLISRVQEATILQERYMNRKSPPLQKMKLTLRLVDRSYKLVDQVTLVTQYIGNTDDLVAATQVGNEAADRLQEAIEFVYGFKQDAAAITPAQRAFVTAALHDTRELLFDFCAYVPDPTKLQNARRRVEEENKLNVDEFDPDLANDAGIFDPIVLPWKNKQLSASMNVGM